MRTRKIPTYDVGGTVVQFFPVPGVPGWHRVVIDGTARFWASPEHRPNATGARLWLTRWTGRTAHVDRSPFSPYP